MNINLRDPFNSLFFFGCLWPYPQDVEGNGFMSPKFMRDLEVQLMVVATERETSYSVDVLCEILRECSYYYNCVAYTHQRLLFEMNCIDSGALPPSGKRYQHLVSILKVVNLLVEEYK